jgi:hypothetical protein
LELLPRRALPPPAAANDAKLPLLLLRLVVPLLCRLLRLNAASEG